MKYSSLFKRFTIMAIALIVSSCANEIDKDKNTVKVSTIVPPETETPALLEETAPKKNVANDNEGRLVGVWYDSYTSKNYGKRIGQKVVQMADKKLYFGPCEIDQEEIEIGGISLKPYSEIVYNGEVYVDMNIPDQRLEITKTGDLKIYDQLGLIDTYSFVFIDPTVIKY